jgi:tripartite-type tricarboxylate transporter receptor subunit TctC
MRRICSLAFVLIAACAASANAVRAQTFQNRPITIVVPLAAGSTTDATARLLAQHAARTLNAQFVIENRPGAGTMLGASMVAKSPPDGHTLLLGGIALAVNPNLYRNVPYDALKDFAPISLLVTAPMVLTVTPSMGVRSVSDLRTKFKSEPLTFSSGGAGTLPHLAGELFKSKSGLSLRHVPYRGGGPAFSDVVAGHVNMMFATPVVKQSIDKGDVHALAVSGRQRVKNLPDVPTFAEAGLPLPEIDFGAYFGLLAPAGTPQPVIDALARAFNGALEDAGVRAKLDELGLQPFGSTPDAFAKHLQDETARWPGIFAAAGISAN